MSIEFARESSALTWETLENGCKPNRLEDSENRFFCDSYEMDESHKLNLESFLVEQKMYERMKKLLSIYDIWIDGRKITIDVVKKKVKSLKKVEEFANLTKLLFSSASIVGSAIYFVKDCFSMESEWSSKLLAASGVIGSMSFVCDLLTQYFTKSSIDTIIRWFLMDQDNFEALTSEEQCRFIFNFHDENFPHGINNDIVLDIMTSPLNFSKHIQRKSEDLDRKYKKSKYFKSLRSFGIFLNLPSNNIKFGKGLYWDEDYWLVPKLMPRQMKRAIYEPSYVNCSGGLPSAARCPTESISEFDGNDDEAFEIFNAIFLSNASKDKKLLQDTKFMRKVTNFSKSSFGKLCWKILNYRRCIKLEKKKQLYAEMKSVLKMDKLFWPFLSLATFPLSSNTIANAAAIFVISSVMAFDAFCELTIKIESKEAGIARRMSQILVSEYEDLKFPKHEEDYLHKQTRNNLAFN